MILEEKERKKYNHDIFKNVKNKVAIIGANKRMNKREFLNESEREISSKTKTEKTKTNRKDTNQAAFC